MTRIASHLHEFVEQLVNWGRQGDVSRVPVMRTQLVAARNILLAHRAAATPVAVARNLGRADETLNLTTLGELDPETVDMLTLVLVGNSETRLIPGRQPRIYTPRGYEAKMAKPDVTESSP